jgi:flavin reductase
MMKDQRMDSPGDAYRKGMRRLAAGVSLITTRDRGQRHGMAATAVTSVTAAPPTLLVCVNREASIHAPLLATGRFCVNVLSEGHDDLPAIFADSAKRAERFDHGEWYDLMGVPVLRGAEVAFICEAEEHGSVGSHTVILGRVVDVPELRPAPRPLIWHEGAMRTLAKGG